MTDAATQPRFAVAFSGGGADWFDRGEHGRSVARHMCPACGYVFDTLGDEARSHACPHCGWREGAPLPLAIGGHTK